MKRLPVYAVLLLLLGGLVFIGGMAFLPEGDSHDPATIAMYDADFVVDEGGDLHATETLTVRFPDFPARHGIFRFFDHRDPNAPYDRRKPHDISVTRAGEPEEFELLSEADGRYTNVKIGSAHRTVRGEQVYVIRYVIDDVLLPVDGGERSRFYWDLVPSGWQMDIATARLRVSLPGEPEQVFCHVGAGQQGGCTAQAQGDSLSVELQDLEAGTPVTVSTELPIETPEQEHRQLWPTRLDGIFGQSTVGAVLALLLGLGAAVLGYRLSHSTREKAPSFPLMYAPPEGVGPAQAAYVLKEKVDTKAFVASLMHAAEHGAATFTRDGGTWTIAGADESRRAALDPVTEQLLLDLAVGARPFTASPDSVESGKRLEQVLAAFTSGTRHWAQGSGVMTMAGVGGASGVLVIGAVILAGVIAFMNPLDASIWAIVPGLFAVFGIEALAPGAGTRRTRSGRELWSRTGGFHRVLSTPSAEARFDFAGRKDLYTAYLPWAVAFDCADEWAKKYRVEVGEEPPAPSYWGGYGGVHTGAYVSQMVDSFDSTVDSAISSYQATQSSSSGGGGGGGFGGGGGGGGGGGSW